MSIEKDIQDYYIQMLQKYSIDFLRLKNQGHKGKSKGAYSYGVFQEGVDNNKYFPDLLFVFNWIKNKSESKLKLKWLLFY